MDPHELYAASNCWGQMESIGEYCWRDAGNRDCPKSCWGREGLRLLRASEGLGAGNVSVSWLDL